ncbi:MAG: helix-turn-helix domain-containing protein [Chthoniobacterales bacterium]
MDSELHPITDYFPEKDSADPFFVGCWEEALGKLRNRLRPHRHDFYQIWLITHGAARWSVDFNEVRVEAGALVFAPPGSVHTWTSLDDAKGFILCFAEEFLHLQNLPVTMIRECPGFDPVRFVPALHLNDHEFERIQALWDRILEEYKERRPRYRMALAIKLWELFVEIQRLLPENTGAKSTRLSHLTIRLFRLLNDQPCKIQSAARLADSLRVSRSWLNQQIKRETGKNLTQHIQARVMLEAKRLLAHSEYNVSEIAFELGFKDPGYFARLFRQYESCSPNEFRDQFR